MTSEQIVKDNLNLIFKIASYFYGAEKEDLVQAGMFGLLKAHKKFDPNCGAKFSTYAYDYIYGEMYLVASKKTIKINKDTLKLYKYIEKTRYEEAQKLGYIPNNFEVAKIMNMNASTIDFACMSAAAILSTDDQSDNERSVYETLSASESTNVDDKILLEDSLKHLSENEQKVIRQRYYKDKTQSDAAKSLNMSQVMISRLEKKGLEKMRKYINA